MDKYLLDTNVFFDLLYSCSYEGIFQEAYNRNQAMNAECYISEITKVEILSVIGKKARGKQKQIQVCDRQIEEDGTRCLKEYYDPGQKRWNSNKVGALLKLLKDIFEQNSPCLKIGVLPFTSEIMVEAEKFITYAFKYKFASLDALIAGTAIYYSDKDLTVITHDRSFRKALEVGGVHTIEKVPDSIWGLTGFS